MVEIPEVTIDRSWSIPDKHITYLETGSIYIQLKNNSDHLITIEKVLCRFQSEAGLDPCDVLVEPKVSIKPHNITAPIALQFMADLQLAKYTNSYRFAISYRDDDAGNITHIDIDSHQFIIVVPRPADKKFFISHRDPLDSNLARRLRSYLCKIGFDGYMAEDDKRPGLDLWDEKILPAIATCTALIVLWTKNAADKPSKISREMKFAKKLNKRVMVIKQKRVPLPTWFPKNTEYLPTDGKLDDQDLMSLVKAIDRMYMDGSFE